MDGRSLMMSAEFSKTWKLKNVKAARHRPNTAPTALVPRMKNSVSRIRLSSGMTKKAAPRPMIFTKG